MSLTIGWFNLPLSSFNTRTGAVTLSSTDVTNALGFTPVTNARTITINGSTQDLSANVTFTTGGVTSFNTRDGAVTLSSSDVTTALGFTPVTQARTLTINGQGYDLSADRSWTITPSSGMRNVTQYIATAGQTTFTITGGYTAGLIDIFLNGVRIPESDFTATNGTTVVFTTGVKVNDVVTAVLYTASATSGITGAGTANYLAKWSGTSAITNSSIQDNGSLITIGNAIASTLTSGIFLYNSSGGSNVIQARINNTSGDMRLGIEGATAGTMQIGTLAYAAVFGNQANNPTQFTSNGNVRMTITSDGKIGMGTSSPSFNLQIKGSDYGILAIDTTGSYNSQLRFHINGSILSAITAVSANSSLVFYNNGSDRMMLNSSGYLGINTSSPSYMLHLNGGNVKLQASSNSAQQYYEIINPTDQYNWARFGGGLMGTGQGYAFISCWNSGVSEIARFNGNGNVGIATTAPNVRLHVYGEAAIAKFQQSGAGYVAISNNQIWALTESDTPRDFYIQYSSTGTTRINFNGGAVYAGGVRLDTLSDRRMKTDIVEINNALQTVNKLNGKKFHLIDEEKGKIRYGFIAQELEGVLDEFVINSNNKFLNKATGEEINNIKSVENWASSWSALLVEAIKELSSDLNIAKKEIEILKAK